MADVLRLILAVLASLFKSRAELEAENLVLRQQINVLSRRMPKRPSLTNIDRLLFVWLYRWFPSTAGALAIVRPEAIAQPRRQTESSSRATRPHWRDEPGEPTVGSAAHPWRAAQAGFELAQSTVANYMVCRRGPPSQGWKTFLCNHAPHITAIDMFIVSTVGFRLWVGHHSP